MENEKNYFGIDYHDGYEGESFMTLFEESDEFIRDRLKAFIEYWKEEGALTDDNDTDFIELITASEVAAANKYSRNSYSDRIKLAGTGFKSDILTCIAKEDIEEFLELISRRPDTVSF